MSSSSSSGLPMNTAVSGGPRTILRIEALAVLAAGVVAYHAVGGSWVLFAVLFFAPDLSMLGYLGGPRVGAVVYNVVHTYAAPAVLAGLMVVGLVPAHWGICVIWASHIGFDRTLGYGLKFSSAFQDTHFGKIGRSATPV
jgi:Domain of unknown function (DUF4260)